MSGKNTLTYQKQQIGTLTQRMQRIFPNKIFSCCKLFCPFLDRFLFPSSFYLQGVFLAPSGFFKRLQRNFFFKFQFFCDFQNSVFYKFVFHRFQSNQSKRKICYCTCILHVISALEIKDIG